MSKWVTITGGVIAFVLFLAAVGWLWANGRYRDVMAEADGAWRDMASRPTPDPGVYTADMVRDLPEIAQRYLNHAIAAGTPLLRRVELSMTGDFLLGDRGAQKTFAMQAKQILAPPHAFVWKPQMSLGPIRMSGSDGLHGGHGWTRFWLYQAVPLVQQAGGADLNRAAAARPAIEAIWAPATLLPVNGAEWTQTGPDTAEVTFGAHPGAPTISLRVDANGALQEVWTMRWSDTNVDQTYRLQPFGGVIEAEATFEGFTVPSRVIVGNHFGSDDFLPFFIATVTVARYF